ncbi:hypothetical protein [Candidatus Amarobacter glycogenicus]|uniref:hypothetical protein n=1 Tax=Candidatus Amarobacter glycogenicus TaxID=3140699 RepID=UPI003134ACAE|nr:hypothetical protein [Dehalococcoidia bacterium]
MTLALYGKSRKRQGGLIFSAFMAIMVAAIGGVRHDRHGFRTTTEYDRTSHLPERPDGAWTIREVAPEC